MIPCNQGQTHATIRLHGRLHSADIESTSNLVSQVDKGQGKRISVNTHFSAINNNITQYSSFMYEDVTSRMKIMRINHLHICISNADQ